jgi:hypothetical protein
MIDHPFKEVSEETTDADSIENSFIDRSHLVLEHKRAIGKDTSVSKGNKFTRSGRLLMDD